jgi:hypothetical protein
MLAGAAFAISTASASAGLIVAPAASCDEQPVSKVFSAWNDHADYTPLPGGDFEGEGDGWSTTGGASTVSGNSPYHVGSDADATSLSLPPGSSATSAPICIGIEHPTMRFFANRHSGCRWSPLRVDVLFENAAGNVNSLPIAFVSNDGSWQPTSSIATLANLLVAPGEHTQVRFRFKAYGAGWSVDDIFVDPYHRR